MNEKHQKTIGNYKKKFGNKAKAETPGKNSNKKNNNVFTEKYFNPNENFSKYMRDHKHKKGIVITGRVHPGESN